MKKEKKKIKMNNTVKNVLFFGVPVVIAIGIFAYIKIVNPFQYHFTEIDLNKFVTLNNVKDTTMIYVKDESFDEGKVYSNVIKTVFNGSKKTIYSLDYNALNDEEKNIFLGANMTLKEMNETEGGFTTPMFIVIDKNSTTIKVGILEKNELESFVKENKLK